MDYVLWLVCLHFVRYSLWTWLLSVKWSSIAQIYKEVMWASVYISIIMCELCNQSVICREVTKGSQGCIEVARYDHIERWWSAPVLARSIWLLVNRVKSIGSQVWMTRHWLVTDQLSKMLVFFAMDLETVMKATVWQSRLPIWVHITSHYSISGHYVCLLICLLTTG